MKRRGFLKFFSCLPFLVLLGCPKRLPTQVYFDGILANEALAPGVYKKHYKPGHFIRRDWITGPKTDGIFEITHIEESNKHDPLCTLKRFVGSGPPPGWGDAHLFNGPPLCRHCEGFSETYYIHPKCHKKLCKDLERDLERLEIRI